MKILVCGGRRYLDYGMAKLVLDEYEDIDLIIHGNARGADMLGQRYATDNNIPIQKFPAEWDIYGKAAGYIRNELMLHTSEPDLVVAFPGGRGTENMVQLAKKHDYEVREVTNGEI